MSLRLYNTLTKRQETFAPLDPAGRRVTFYSCGPTVYDYAHIGNFRSFLNADVLRRTLELLGYDVVHVMNITDVGHMTEDTVADGQGEDRMQVASRRIREDKKSGRLPPEARDIDPDDPYAISEFYAHAFLEDARTLGLKVAFEAEQRPELMPRPTGYIPQMIELVETLIDRGHAYVASDGVVYFHVPSFADYGDLSGNVPQQLRSGEGGRVDAATQAVKKHPGDFMLWKPDPAHIMRWPSPWGEGYPGWHLECSVMAMSLLGAETDGVIDIHSGGEDNIFPHHECEIAQTCGATGQAQFARYWFHTRFLIAEGHKMSKSRGNFFTVRDLLDKGASPAAIRLELVKTHYRSNANFTIQGMIDSQRQIDRWGRLEGWLKEHEQSPLVGPGHLSAALGPFRDALCDDLNVAGALGILNDAVSRHDTDAQPPPSGDGNATYASELDALNAINSVLGVLDLARDASIGSDLDPAAIDAMLAERETARKEGDWGTADRIRDELLEMGVAIKDAPAGTTWSRIVK